MMRAILAALVLAAALPAGAQTVTIGGAVGITRADGAGEAPRTAGPGMNFSATYTDPIAAGGVASLVYRFALACQPTPTAAGSASLDCGDEDTAAGSVGIRLSTRWRGGYRIGIGVGILGAVGGEAFTARAGYGGDDRGSPAKPYTEVVLSRAISSSTALTLTAIGVADGDLALTGIGAGLTIRLGRK